MAKLTKEQVEHVAKLARLAITEKEKAKFTEQLSAILDYVGELNEVDTKGVVPIAQITGLENIMTEDKVYPCGISREDLLANAPKTFDGFIKTRKVFE